MYNTIILNIKMRLKALSVYYMTYILISKHGYKEWKEISPGPASVDCVLLLELITTMLPGPLAVANGDDLGTTIGETYTAMEPSGFLLAAPRSLIEEFRRAAYSKSTEVILEIPLIGTVVTSMVFP